MKHLNRDLVLAAKDLPLETVNVPEWGGSVTVRTLTGDQRDDFEIASIATRGPDKLENMRKLRARLAVACVVGEDHEPMFSEADVAALGAKSSKALDRIFGVAIRLNGLTQADVAELAKNSDSAPQGDSTSA